MLAGLVAASTTAFVRPPSTAFVRPPVHHPGAGIVLSPAASYFHPLLLRGGARRAALPVATIAAAPPAEESYRPERALQPTAFVFVLSVAICALAPPQQLIASLGVEKATKLLSLVSSASALTEILLAPVVGALSDSIGRKPVLLMTLGAVCLFNGIAAVTPYVPLIALSRFICNLVVGLFFLASGATLGDAYRTQPGKLAAASGTLYALVNGGFAVGIALSRFIPSSLQWAYGVSSVVAAAAVTVASLKVKETMTPSERVPFRLKAFNPLSCVRLLRYGSEMRLLALLLAVTLQPIFMGDVLQLFAIKEWALDKGQIATLFTLIPVLGAAGNVLGGRCVKFIGVQRFTAVATLSNILFWIGCCISYKAALICATIGFLGPARTLGASTALTTVGASKGIPQGQLSGDRSNLIAILKVVGPAVYGQLYVRGAAAGVPIAPFLLNLLLTFSALCLAPFALMGAEAREGPLGKDKKRK